jgi:hypothetical protein
LIFVVEVDPGRPGHRLDLYEWALEEAEEATRQSLAPAHDDRLGAELALDLGDQLIDRAAPVGAGRGAHAWMTPIVSTLIPGEISL